MFIWSPVSGEKMQHFLVPGHDCHFYEHSKDVAREKSIDLGLAEFAENLPDNARRASVFDLVASRSNAICGSSQFRILRWSSTRSASRFGHF